MWEKKWQRCKVVQQPTTTHQPNAAVCWEGGALGRLSFFHFAPPRGRRCKRASFFAPSEGGGAKWKVGAKWNQLMSLLKTRRWTASSKKKETCVLLQCRRCREPWAESESSDEEQKQFTPNETRAPSKSRCF